MRWIEIKVPKLYYLFYLFYPFIGLIKNQILSQESISLDILLPSIGLTLFGLPFYILNIYHHVKKQTIQSKTEQRKTKKRKTPFKQIHFEIQDTQITITALVIIALSLIFVVLSYFEPIVETESNLLFYELFMLIFRVLFSKLIAKTELFIHHYVSLGIILIGVVLFDILLVNFDDYDKILYYCFFSLAYALVFPYTKVIIERKYIKPITLIFYIGILMNVFIWLIFLIVSFIEQNMYIKDFQSLPNAFVSMFKDWTSIGSGFSYMVIQSINIIGFIYIIHFDNPITEGRLSQFSDVIIFLFNTSKYTMNNVILKGIGSIFCLIGILIFIEIVVIRVCGMNLNTKQEIIKRSNEEIVSIEILAFDNVDEEVD